MKFSLDELFSDAKNLQQALTHRSAHSESRSDASAVGDNERFEFLGDAVIDLICTETLMAMFPEDDEGLLSKKRASLVNEDSLADVARRLDLGRRLRLSKAEVKMAGREKPRLLASAFEALVGALYLDRGIDITRDFLKQTMEPELAQLKTSAAPYEKDYKTRCQELSHVQCGERPVYDTIDMQGPSHAPVFSVRARLKNWESVGTGTSKRAAEQEAARQMIALLEEKRNSQNMGEACDD